MNHQVRARLFWKIANPGDAISPRGRRFVVPAKFAHQGDDWTSNAWSLVVESDKAMSADGSQVVNVGFLMPDGPRQWLSPGQRFSLYEGKLLLAEGVVE
jgi:hypothetical protein